MSFAVFTSEGQSEAPGGGGRGERTEGVGMKKGEALVGITAPFPLHAHRKPEHSANYGAAAAIRRRCVIGKSAV